MKKRALATVLYKLISASIFKLLEIISLEISPFRSMNNLAVAKMKVSRNNIPILIARITK